MFLPSWMTLRLFARSFFLQASWNVERMQNLGFLYALLPALKRKYAHDPSQLDAACLRHLDLFNSHPYMAGPILGAVAHLETERNTAEESPAEIVHFKESAMTAFAAMGDSLFWRVLRPFFGACALLFALENRFWAVLVFLVPYNTVHLWVRGYGLYRARRLGIQILRLLRVWDIPTRVLYLKMVFPIVLGLLSAKLAVSAERELSFVVPWTVLPLVFLFYILIRNRVPIPVLLGSAFLSVMVGIRICSV